MAMKISGALRHKNSIRGALLTGVFLATSVLGACSSVPDAINPVEWYKGTVDLFAGDKKAVDEKGRKSNVLTADRGKTPPGSGKSFPNLSSVDQQARARDRKGGGLSADTERPKYAPSIRRQGESTEAPAAPVIASPAGRGAPPPVAATMPPPKAVPTAPVKMAKPTTMPKLAPPTLTLDQREVEERLARQLAEIRAQALKPGEKTVPSRMPAPPGNLDTIVISSEGIENVDTKATQLAARAEMRPAVKMPPALKTGASRMEAAPRPMTGAVVKVATILFDNGSSKLKANDKRILAAVKRLQRKRGGVLRIVGHASTRTRNMPTVKHIMTNFKISVDRADEVVSELVRLGLKKENIEVAAVSDMNPIYYETMPSGEAGNRRTEIYLLN